MSSAAELYPRNKAIEPKDKDKNELDKIFIPNEKQCTKCAMLPGRYFCVGCPIREAPTCENCIASVVDMSLDTCRCIKHG